MTFYDFLWDSRVIEKLFLKLPNLFITINELFSFFKQFIWPFFHFSRV